MTTDEGADSQEIRPTRMTVREQQAGYVVAAVAVVVAIALAAAGAGNLATGVAGVVAAAVLGVSARFGHRIVTAFIAILVGFVPIFTVPGEFVFLGYGGYLMFRTSRAQAKLNASRPRLTPQQRREARQARRAAKTPGTTGTAPAPAAKRPTTPNRRYTPPKTKSGRRR